MTVKHLQACSSPLASIVESAKVSTFRTMVFASDTSLNSRRGEATNQSGAFDHDPTMQAWRVVLNYGTQDCGLLFSEYSLAKLPARRIAQRSLAASSPRIHRITNAIVPVGFPWQLSLMIPRYVTSPWTYVLISFFGISRAFNHDCDRRTSYPSSR